MPPISDSCLVLRVISRILAILTTHVPVPTSHKLTLHKLKGKHSTRTLIELAELQDKKLKIVPAASAVI